MCLFLWQASIYPVLGIGSETVNQAISKGPNSSIAMTMKIVIQRGETLWDLARRYQTTVDELVNLNQMKRPDQIREGQTLWIPNGETKVKSEDLKTTDVKDSSEEVLTAVTQVKVAEKVTYSPWWVKILRGIPAFATVHKLGYNTADLNISSPSGPESTIQTYEIFVNKDTELPEKLPTDSLPDTKDDKQKLVAQKVVPSTPSESQIHSRGLGRLVSEEELELLSRVIYAEARGEDFLGQVAVGAVVLNRLEDPRFPKTIRGIIYQNGAFTAVDDRQIHLEPNDQAYKAAEAALSGLDPTKGAIFYYNPRIATDQWIKSRTVVERIGNHTFSI